MEIALEALEAAVREETRSHFPETSPREPFRLTDRATTIPRPPSSCPAFCPAVPRRSDPISTRSRRRNPLRSHERGPFPPLWEQEVGGSNPLAPTIIISSSYAIHGRCGGGDLNIWFEQLGASLGSIESRGVRPRLSVPRPKDRPMGWRPEPLEHRRRRSGLAAGHRIGIARWVSFGRAGSSAGPSPCLARDHL